MSKYLTKSVAATISALLLLGCAAPAFAADAAVEKKETSYLILNADGSVQEQITSDWLHSDDGFDAVTDESDLSDIQNLKSDVMPEQSGNTLKWTTDETDIYYQGKNSAQAPVGVSIEYTLGGKAVTADELKGQSGHLVATVKLTNNTGEEVTVDIREKRTSSTEPRGKITLYQALPKGDKMEWIIQKSVELGVFRIVPILTSRCVSRPDAKSMEKKVQRFNKIAAEAAKQSGRGILPKVSGLLTLEQAAKDVSGKGIVFYEKGGARLAELIAPEDTEIGIFVGSEGGFAPEEIALLEKAGVEPATLGRRILRCETAPICGLSVLLSLLGDI